MDIKESIINQAQKLGIDLIGFTTCDPFEDIRHVLLERQKKNYLSGFEEGNIEKRINPELLLDKCRTIISIGISYYTDTVNLNKAGKAVYRCSMSRSSWGEDYHNVLGRMLSKLSEFIEENYNALCKVFVDTGPLPEREAAHRAGIGFIGKNGFIIHPELGSFIFLGELLTTLYIEPDKAMENECGDCDLCIKACPSGALIKPLMLNAKECISYITQGRDTTFEQCKKVGNSIYGCDICQAVCPKNQRITPVEHSEFVPEDWNYNPDALDVLKLDNKKYNETFKRTSSGWRGKKTLQRNAIIALGNSGDICVAPYIISMLDDSRQDIRAASINALYNLLRKECVSILEDHYKIEDSEDIKCMIDGIIRNI